MIGLAVSAQDKFELDLSYQKHTARAFLFYEQKGYEKSALSYDSLFTHNKGDGLASDFYNAACSWAMAGNVEKAFFDLCRAVVNKKYDNADHLLIDTDLGTLHADKRWQPLVDIARSNKEKMEARLNKPVVELLERIYTDDQSDRGKLDTVQKQFGWNSKQMDSLWKRIKYLDSVDLVQVKNIIDTYGWPGPDEVGQKGASTIFLVIQHSDSLTQVTYVPLMREAVKKGKAKASKLALLEDRILVKQNKEQIYGSQVKRNGDTNKTEFFPVRDEVNVNKRRASVGLGPLEEYARLFGFEYVPPRAGQHKP